MKKFVFIFVIIGIFVLSVVLAIVIRDLKHKTWMEYTLGDIDRLAAGVEVFREGQGTYPERLSDLQKVPGLEDAKFLRQILDGNSGNQYQYRVLSNGFAITVTKPSQLLSKKEVMEKLFTPSVTK